MKKKFSMILAIVMITAALAGCGREGGTDSSGQTGSVKDYVYKVTPLELKKGAEGYSSLMKNGDCLYAYGYQYGDDGSTGINLARLSADGALQEEGNYQVEAGVGIMNFSCDEQGMIYAIKDIYAEEPDEEGNYIDQYYLAKLTIKGEELFCISLNDIPQVKELAQSRGWLYTGGIVVNKDRIYVNVLDNYFVFDNEGNFLKMLDSEGDHSLEGMYLYPLADGKIVAYGYDEEGASYLAYADMETGQVTDKTKIPGAASYDFAIYPGNSRYEVFLVDSYGVYGYNMGDSEKTKLMDYVDSDLGSYGIYNITTINDQEFLATYDDEITYETCIGRFTKVDPKDIKDKKTLVLACAGLDWNIRNSVVNFNKNSEEYRITIQDYSSMYNLEADYKAGVNRLNADIVSGKVPDILVIHDDMPVESYISKGLFEDLKPYIEKDEELDIDNYMPNVLEAYSVDGKLYRLVPSYMVSTLIAKTSEVGEEGGWTVSDVNQLMSTKPDGTMFLNYIDRKAMLLNYMSIAGYQFVDWENGTCSFDSDSFVELLEFLKQFPEVVDDSIYTDDYWENYDSMWREGKVVAMMYTVSGYRDYNYVQKGTFGEPVTMIGYPSGNGEGSAIMPTIQMAMSAKSSYKEGAWQFLRYYLTDEYQNNLTYGLPLSIKKLNEMGEEATKNPTYTDENGNEVETQDYFYLNGVEVPIDPMTKEEVEKFKETLYSLNQIYNYDEDLIQIIEEESAAYFNGQKSVRDVSAIIQSRAKIYVNENR